MVIFRRYMYRIVIPSSSNGHAASHDVISVEAGGEGGVYQCRASAGGQTSQAMAYLLPGGGCTRIENKE